jgi:hypothetical protein
MNSSSRKKISNVCLNGALSNVARSSYFYFCFFVHFFAIGRSKTLDEKKMELKKKNRKLNLNFVSRSNDKTNAIMFYKWLKSKLKNLAG